MLERSPSAWIQAPGAAGEQRWLRFANPRATLVANQLGDVLPALEEVEREVAAGAHAVGLLCYEAGPAFDNALVAAEPGPWPLAWWGLFEAPEEVDPEALDPLGEKPTGDGQAGGVLAGLDWRPLVSEAAYLRSVERIRELIAAGETYQVNYTFPLEAAFSGDAFELFRALCRAQLAGCCAYLDLGRFAVCSASPELFFELDGETLRSRPMKGTAPRGLGSDDDDARARALGASEKDRAENLMIVDMVRNDLGKVARPGSVQVEKLFEVESYPTLHQLTSTVSSLTAAPYREIFRALFPCASITGAPKVRTSEIIRELELHPRGAYTGSLGWIAPGRRARFNVAIRTAVVDRLEGRVRYGVGGGIVWDSDPRAELEECRTKAKVLGAERPPFELLETLLWRPRSGFFLLERHFRRLLASARYFGWRVDREEVAAALERAVEGLPPERHRVRLLVDREGNARVEATPLPCAGRETWSVAIGRRPIDPSDAFLFHKTTHRRVYTEALAEHPEADDVLLTNPAGELTELTRANLVLHLDGSYLTPPVSCGLLAGTYRAELLARGRLREAVLRATDLERAAKIFAINSVRGWIRLEIVPAISKSARMGVPPPSLTSSSRP